MAKLLIDASIQCDCSTFAGHGEARRLQCKEDSNTVKHPVLENSGQEILRWSMDSEMVPISAKNVGCEPT